MLKYSTVQPSALSICCCLQFTSIFAVNTVLILEQDLPVCIMLRLRDFGPFEGFESATKTCESEASRLTSDDSRFSLLVGNHGILIVLLWPTLAPALSGQVQDSLTEPQPFIKLSFSLNLPAQLSIYMYRVELLWVKGSVCLVLEFALPPFSPPLPSVVEVTKQNTHQIFDPIYN